MNKTISHLIAPSVLSADFANLQRDIEMINTSEADWFHVDVMDGVFVPNISFGFPVIEALRKYAAKPLDVHLMIVNPDQYIARVADTGASVITVHYEACTHLHRTVQSIHANGCKAGVALNPHTSVEMIKDIISDLDLVLIMSVNPGFGGQKFIPNTLHKVREARSMANLMNPDVAIEVDGGIGMDNISQLLEAGANVLVAGNAVFAAESPTNMIAEMKRVNAGLLKI